MSTFKRSYSSFIFLWVTMAVGFILTSFVTLWFSFNYGLREKLNSIHSEAISQAKWAAAQFDRQLDSTLQLADRIGKEWEIESAILNQSALTASMHQLNVEHWTIYNMVADTPLKWMLDDQSSKKNKAEVPGLNLMETLGWSVASLTAHPFTLERIPYGKGTSALILARWGKWEHPKNEHDLGWAVILFIQPKLETVNQNGFQNILLNGVGEVLWADALPSSIGPSLQLESARPEEFTPFIQMGAEQGFLTREDGVHEQIRGSAYQLKFPGLYSMSVMAEKRVFQPFYHLISKIVFFIIGITCLVIGFNILWVEKLFKIYQQPLKNWYLHRNKLIQSAQERYHTEMTSVLTAALSPERRVVSLPAFTLGVFPCTNTRLEEVSWSCVSVRQTIVFLVGQMIYPGESDQYAFESKIMSLAVLKGALLAYLDHYIHSPIEIPDLKALAQTLNTVLHQSWHGRVQFQGALVFVHQQSGEIEGVHFNFHPLHWWHHQKAQILELPNAGSLGKSSTMTFQVGQNQVSPGDLLCWLPPGLTQFGKSQKWVETCEKLFTAKTDASIRLESYGLLAAISVNEKAKFKTGLEPENQDDQEEVEVA